MLFLNQVPEITLFVTNKQVTAFRAFATETTSLGQWPLEIEGLLRDDLQAFLSTHRKAVFTIVIDISEEEFSMETLPRIKARDRDAMLKRKLAQRYREPDFRLTYPLNKPTLREWTSARQTTYIFSALTQITPLEGILKALAQEKAKLRGVYTSTFLGAAAGELLNLPKNILLILEHEESLRQILILDGKVRFARLAQFVEQDNPDFYREELARISQYLLIGRLIDRDYLSAGNLKVAILSNRNQATLDATWPGGNRMDITWLNGQALKAQYSIKDLPTNPFSIAWLYAWPKLRKTCKTYYQPNEGMRFWRVELARKQILLVCISLLLSIMAFSGWRLNEIFEQQKVIEDNKLRTHRVRVEYQQIKERFPVLPVPPSEMRTKVDLLDNIIGIGTKPDQLLELIAHDFDNFPDLRITNIAWKAAGAGTEPKQMPQPGATTNINSEIPNRPPLPTISAAVTSVLTQASNSIGNQPSTNTPQPTSREVKLEGLIIPSKPLSKQEANSEVQRLLKNLEGRCRCKITAQLPFDISLDGNITDKTGQHSERIAPAKFILTLYFAKNTDAN